LAERFEYCVYGLNRVKTDLQTLREERYLLWKQNFPNLLLVAQALLPAAPRLFSARRVEMSLDPAD
jgi:hypothetical protein